MNAMNDVELVTPSRRKLLTSLLIISLDLMDAESVLTKLPIVAKVAVGVGVMVSLYLIIVNLSTLIIVLHIGYGGGGGGGYQQGGGGGGYGQQGGGYGQFSEPRYFLQTVMLTFPRRRRKLWWWWWGRILKPHMIQVGKSASDKVAY